MGSTLRNDTRRAVVLARIAKAWDKRPDLTLMELLQGAFAGTPDLVHGVVRDVWHVNSLVALVSAARQSRPMLKNLLLTCALLCVSMSDARSSTPAKKSAPAFVELQPLSIPPLDVPPPPPLPKKLVALTRYLESLMNAWPHTSLPTVDFHSFAQDIAEVALREPPAWDGKRFPDHDRSKTGALLLTLGYWEGSRFAAYVDQDLCSNPEWRHSDEGRHQMHLGGDCDGDSKGVAKAHSSWQLREVWFPDGEACTRETVADRQWAVHCALRVARASLKRHGEDEGPIEARLGTLADYTGEWDRTFHPAADVRLHWARKQWAKHPFQP